MAEITSERRHPKRKLYPYDGDGVSGFTPGGDIIFTPYSGEDYFKKYDSTAGRQVTTSYRSGKRTADDVTPEQLIVDTGGNRDMYDTGHPFQTELRTLSVSHPRVHIANNHPLFSGRQFFNGPLVNNGIFGEIPDWDKVHYGTIAFNKTYPTKSVAGMATFLGELKDGLPDMLGSNLYKLINKNAFFGKNPASGVGKSLGSEYLNFQFGWVPFVADLKKMLYVVLNSYEIIKQYKRDSGRVVRRKYHFPDSSTTDSNNNRVTYAATGPLDAEYFRRKGDGGSQDYYDSSSAGYTITRNFASYSFSGAYSYYLNMNDEFMGRMEKYSQLANKLLGLRLTPDVVWALAPWSWLADWFSDIGISLENATALSNDGLVMRYGYLMRKSTNITLVHADKYQFNNADFYNINTVRTTVRKERVKAPTPYGFGLQPSDLSDKQWSILAALGMTNGGGARSFRGSGT